MPTLLPGPDDTSSRVDQALQRMISANARTGTVMNGSGMLLFAGALWLDGAGPDALWWLGIALLFCAMQATVGQSRLDRLLEAGDMAAVSRLDLPLAVLLGATWGAAGPRDARPDIGLGPDAGFGGHAVPRPAQCRHPA